MQLNGKAPDAEAISGKVSDYSRLSNPECCSVVASEVLPLLSHCDVVVS